ncbi:MAG: N-acetyl-gamma-glutamyl-phosphate reductase [Clostridiales Family XIII bacterium]|jgi:N-acetyl-gamma-glutamyl-phosphate reductase|nr:N-acetyl-gamma-glutamyl-phosphate reductase [Clostridiales Family XIII bacterium]
MSTKVFIDGNSGTTGLKIESLLLQVGGFELIRIDPALRHEVRVRLEKIGEADITVLCLPDKEASEIAALAPKTVRIIDASTAHRTREDWTYGLPELSPVQREQIRSAARVAVPGCHATGFILLAKPLIDAGFACPDYPFSVHSVTGYSGGGKNMIAQYAEQDALLKAPRAYALKQMHKHLPEMTKQAGLDAEPIFTPHVADFYSGLSVMVPIHRRLLQKGVGLTEIRNLFEKRYADERFITIRAETYDPEDGFLSADAMQGRNDLEILITGNEDRIMLTARYDNLGKGASGAVLQCMNIMLGLPEERGLL